MEEKKNLILAVDCDEVLTNISPLWAELIHKNGDYFGKYFDLMPNFSYKIPSHVLEVLRRKEFHINKSFRKEGLELSEEEENELFKRFFELYDNDKFYKHVQPTKLANSLVNLCSTNYLNKLYIVSRISEGTLSGKKEFLEKLFKNNKKWEFIPVKPNEKKSTVINNLGRVDAFFDDELTNIRDVITNCDSTKPMDLYIPKLGYNFPTEDLIKLCEENEKKIIYYNAI